MNIQFPECNATLTKTITYVCRGRLVPLSFDDQVYGKWICTECKREIKK